MKQTEVWLVNLNPTVGDEINKVRPAIIVNVNSLARLSLRVVVPITDWKERYTAILWMHEIEPDATNGLAKKSAIDCFQVCCVAEDRLIKKIGQITPEQMEEIKIKIAIIVGYL